MIAVLYGAEVGEQMTNLVENIDDEFQIKFTSGITEIVIANTPMSFGSTRPVPTHDYSYKSFNDPIHIRLPITKAGQKGYDTI